MSVEPQYSYEMFLALVVAILVSMVLRRRQRKQGKTVGAARMITVFVVAALTALLSLLSLAFVVRQFGLEPGKWSLQVIQIASALMAYLVAGQVLARFRADSKR